MGELSQNRPERPAGFEAHPERINKNGRPRKWVNTLKDQGYKKSEIMDCLQVLMSMNEEELQEVYDDGERSILEQTVAGALLKAKQGKSLYNLDTIITRVFGQPKMEVEQQITGDIKITLNLNGDLPNNPTG